MRLLICAALLIAVGCGSEPAAQPDATPPTAASQQPALPFSNEQIENMKRGMDAAKEREAKLLADLKRDKQGTLFPRAEAEVLKSAQQNIGSTFASAATIHATNVEDFGATDWLVTGTYAGPDRNGKPFTSEWEVKMSVFMGGLQVTNVKLGKMKYD